MLAGCEGGAEVGEVDVHVQGDLRGDLGERVLPRMIAIFVIVPPGRAAVEAGVTGLPRRR